ncbi:membrane protein insertase YidC [Buchnera aphidicola (Ceratoglyphina bambusae)]|uniref:membrane protein insertase YidC n=1 Tax=Buchnera aphidicola TaxID=9 RepID=UPI0031B861EE
MYWIRNTFILIFLFVLAFFVYKFNNENFFYKAFQKEKLSNIKINESYKKLDLKDVISIQTDTLKIFIDKKTGDIIKADLLKYKEKINKSDSFSLLKSEKNFLYQANSGLTGLSNYNFVYDEKYNKLNNFLITDSQKELKVPMKWISSDGNISFIKTFIFEKGKYFIEIKYDILNKTNKPLNISMYGNLKQSIIDSQKVNNNYSFGLKTFRGAAYSNDEEKYSKINFFSIDKKENISGYTKNNWIAMVQPYFVTAWIPDTFVKNKIFSEKIDSNVVSVGYTTENFNINSNSSQSISSKLWIGPKIKKNMLEVSDSLYLTIDYGFLWFFSQPLFKLLNYLNSFFNNWGISIIAITCIIKLIMFPISKVQYTQMAKMRSIQGEVNEIKKKYKDNKSVLNKKIIDLYKKNDINPIGGFLPLIIQMPIFLSLYYMLIESVELRHSPFFLWINDLSDKDPYFVLPILMGITTFLLQKISGNEDNIDETQKKIMQFMPIVFTIFFLWFPSGLVLYYIVSNILTIIQQKIIYKQLKKEKNKL